MEIKIQEFTLSLNNDEEVLCKAEKLKLPFYRRFLYVIFFLLTFFIVSFPTFTNKEYLIPAWVFSGYILIFFFGLLDTYISVRDYFFTNIIITNQRLIIIRFNKLITFNCDQIAEISGSPIMSRIFITLKSKKKLSIRFIEYSTFKKYFLSIRKDYDEINSTKTVFNQKLLGLLIIGISFIITLCMIVFSN